MSLGPLSYIAGISVFAGTAIFIIWAKGYKQIRNYKKILFYIACLALFFCFLGEGIALKINIWTYTEGLFSGKYVLGSALETYIFSLFVFLAVSSATLAWSKKEESGTPLKDFFNIFKKQR